MTHKALIQKIRGQFWKRLQAKTSWGKNEVLDLFNQTCATALAAALDEMWESARPSGRYVDGIRVDPRAR